MSEIIEGTQTTVDDSSQLGLLASVEAILFVAGEPISVSQIASVVDQPESMIEAALSMLSEKYRNSGLALQKSRGRIQLTTSPEQAQAVEKFLGLDSFTKLSRAAIETLTIVCYRQPITRPAIDAIRGVNSDGVIRTLLNKGLVEEVGRDETPGRPVLYATTLEFLQHFGLTSIAEMPKFVQDDTHEDGNRNGNGQLLKD
jgi:segregation and condensation protein B